MAGDAFGCGSSRGVAVAALLGCRIRAVIAPSFSFIFGRNAANLRLLCVTVRNDIGPYNAVVDGEDTEVDINIETMNITVYREREKKIFLFELSNMEKQLVACGGMTNAWRNHGTNLWDNMNGDSRELQITCQDTLLPALKDEEADVGKKSLMW